jgi:ParB-like nuclease family protein
LTLIKRRRGLAGPPREQDLRVLAARAIRRTVVVRPHPQKDGLYQLAYGHSRLEAVIQAGIKEVILPVADLSDWDMYQAMVDENDTQQNMTTEIAFENVECALNLLEKAFREIGPEGTWEEFNKALGRNLSVERSTLKIWGGHGFERVRKAFFEGEGIGSGFVKDFVPPSCRT